ncbi:MAG: hypothetical protein LBL95_08955, partial [Deltaproteobacteria bacterium]|nr:hypothetical protein [Deltaproteobacteria bacterium]
AKITNPALVKPSLASSLRSNRLIPERLPDLFEGSQLTVVGRYPEGGQATLTLSGQKGQERQVFSYQADLAQGPTQNGQQIAQLWAQRRIGQIIEEIDLAAQAVPNQELVDELVGLSKAYGIMTPYTSFLAVEDQPLADTAELGRIAQRNLGELEQLTGEDANWQRATKSDLAAAATPAPAPMPMEARISDLKAMGRLEKNLGGSALIPPTIIDGRAFFMKGGRLIEGSLTEEDLRKLKAVKRFSPEYFELARQLEPGQMGFLTQASPLAFSLNGQGFLIEAE